MANEHGLSAARLARNLIIRHVAPDLVTETARFGRAEGRLGPAAEAVEPDLDELVPQKVPEGLSREEVADVARKVLRTDDLSADESFIAEAIIIPDLRPAVFIINGDFDIDHPAWRDLVRGQPAHAMLANATPSVGRIELIGNSDIPYGGTGFVVARNLLMTNRHVAQIFATGLGTRSLRFLDGLGAGVDFLRERSSPEPGTVLNVRKVAMIHPYWDLALLEVDGLDGRSPLTFALDQPDAAVPRRIGVIGYPAFDPRNDAKVQDQVFRGVYQVKRLQPGLFNGRRRVESFGKVVDAGTHDSSTLGGNSGSVVVDCETGHAIGLHFAGIYKDSNFAVPACDLGRDGHMIDAGLNFASPVQRGPGPWDAYWAQADRETIVTPATRSKADDRTGAANGVSGHTSLSITPTVDPTASAKITIPLHIDITLDVSSGAGAPAGGLAPTAAVEKMVEPIHDPIELSRTGYQPDFIGIEVPLPTPRRAKECVALEDGSTELKYHHYSVVMNRARRIALFTASNVDGSKAAKEPDPGHRYTRAGLTGLGDGDVEKWYTDPRIRGTEQLPDRFFNKDRQAFDKGHLVRREDVAWGKTFAEVQAANGDTYFVTNCSPQVAGFNRSNRRDNWGALEDLVLKQAASERYCLFAGPVLADDDPLFTGVDDLGAIKVRIPQKYWKVVVANSSDGLKVFAFVLAQDLSDVAMEFAVPASWVSHMVPLSDLENELGSLDFAQELHAADQFEAAQALGTTPLIESAAAQIAAMEPASTEAVEAGAGHGRFIGLPAQIALAEYDRSASLLAPLSYVDPAESSWSVPIGAWLDGASIPQPFWSIIGGPFEGRYREASIVHDHYCIVRSRPWRDTHRMFFEGMLCRGVSSFKAKIMYYAVYRFGPRWGERNTEGVVELPPVPAPLTDAAAASILEDAGKIAGEDLDVEAIERLADRHSASTDITDGAAGGRDKSPPVQTALGKAPATVEE